MDGDEIGDDEPVLLRNAPALFFRHGGMTLSALRTEARKGKAYGYADRWEGFRDTPRDPRNDGTLPGSACRHGIMSTREL
jgi:hypothetical protein